MGIRLHIASEMAIKANNSKYRIIIEGKYEDGTEYYDYCIIQRPSTIQMLDNFPNPSEKVLHSIWKH